MDLAASLALIAPEILLSVSGLVLLLVAGWAGDKASRAITIVACLVLAACFVMVAPSVCGGSMGAGTAAFGGLFAADAFAGFAKLMIYAASGAVLVVAPAFFCTPKAMRQYRYSI
jgi:NADH-quinone oxidoreductase subunit N